MTITNKLFELSEKEYKIFSEKLIPDTKLEILGVRTPLIKKYAKYLCKDTPHLVNDFLCAKHQYYEEWLLHGFLLSYEKDIDALILQLNNFLPYIDNWAICDCSVMALKIFKKNPIKTLDFIKNCIKSNKPYIVRFGIVALLSYFLDTNFSNEILLLINDIKSEHYYVNMALAWFYSIAIIKQYKSILPLIKSQSLPKFVHNKAIQKATESFRVPFDTKQYLKTLKIK